MRFARMIFNPSEDEPTAGLRGLMALAIGLSAPMWLDWRTELFPLLIGVVGGVGFGIVLLGHAWEQAGART